MTNKLIWLGIVIVGVVTSILWFSQGDQERSLLKASHDLQDQQRDKIVERFIDQATVDLPDIIKRKTLRALVPYDRSDFTILSNGQVAGLQVELLKAYEEKLNRGVKSEADKVRIIWIPTPFDRLISDLLAGKGDVVTTLLTVTKARQEKVAFATAAALTVDELVVTHSSVTDVHQLQDLSGRTVYVLSGSSYEEHLHAINREWEQQGIAKIDVKAIERHLYTEDILKMVQAGILPITVIDDYKAHLWAKVLDHVQVLDDVKVYADNVVGWAVRKDNPKLLKSLNVFVKAFKKGTLMGNMMFKRFINKDWIQRHLAQDEQSKIRKMMPVFSKYAELYDYDVLAALAQAYQESHLNQNRRSHRGAIGVMQLLPSTAADPNVGIKDISILENNVHAGIKYVTFLRNRYFSGDEIHSRDRLLFSWAAYNAGPAKVIRMRRLAKKMGLNPNVWFDHVELASAKMIGRETVQYVRNIYTHYVAYLLVRDKLYIDEP